MKGIKIGELLVEQGTLTQDQVEHILKIQKSTGRPFGDLAERLYGINPRAVESAWVDQYTQLAGVIDLNVQPLDGRCVNEISARQAWQFHIAPLFRDDDNLNIATTADNLVRAVNFATRTFDEPVYFVIVDKSQLREHLMEQYPVPGFIAAFAETMA